VYVLRNDDREKLTSICRRFIVTHGWLFTLSWNVVRTSI
jgi:hypothetical protein